MCVCVCVCGVGVIYNNMIHQEPHSIIMACILRSKKTYFTVWSTNLWQLFGDSPEDVVIELPGLSEVLHV